MKKIFKALFLLLTLSFWVTSGNASEQADILIDYFSNLNSIVKGNAVSKNKVNFAGIGSGDSYQDFVTKFCRFSQKSKTVTEVSFNGGDYSADEFCSKKPSIVPKYPDNEISQSNWEKIYSNVNFDPEYYPNWPVKGKTVYFSIHGNRIDIHASSVFIEGVEFKLKFTFKKLESWSALKGMMIDESAPLTYFSYYKKGRKAIGMLPKEPAEWHRMLSRYELQQLEMYPVNINDYVLKRNEVNKFFMDKYPGKVSGYYSDFNHIRIATKDNRAHVITYFFKSAIHNKKYRKIYEDFKKSKLKKSGTPAF